MIEKEDHFLEEIRAELSLESQEQAKPFVRSVLQALRRTMSRQNAEAITKIFPEFLKSYFSTIGKEEKEVEVEHLDELVELVMKSDEQNKPSLFKSEVQTLSVIIPTLRRILMNGRPVAGIGYPFQQEVLGSC